MSTRIDDGGPAFPTDPETYNGTGLCGMSLRDWFAGMALSGKCGYPVKESIVGHILAKEAYDIADAMLAARKEGR